MVSKVKKLDLFRHLISSLSDNTALWAPRDAVGVMLGSNHRVRPATEGRMFELPLPVPGEL